MARLVLLVCSGGGHLVQMKRLLPAISGHDRIVLATVGESAGRRDELIDEFISLPDFNRQSYFASIIGIPRVLLTVLRIRPSHVISTGAAPGIVGIIGGRLCGARTLWIDSIANTRKLSVSGRIALHVSHCVLTQWRTVSKGDRPGYRGRLI